MSKAPKRALCKRCMSSRNGHADGYDDYAYDDLCFMCALLKAGGELLEKKLRPPSLPNDPPADQKTRKAC